MTKSFIEGKIMVLLLIAGSYSSWPKCRLPRSSNCNTANSPVTLGPSTTNFFMSLSIFALTIHQGFKQSWSRKNKSPTTLKCAMKAPLNIFQLSASDNIKV